MPHTVPRPIHLLGVALCLLAGVAMQARARTMDTTSEEHIRRLKDLQHHLLMAEPAGRAREVRERREHASSRRHRTRKVGLASRSRPAPGGGEQGGSRIPEAVRRFQVTGGAAAATVDNYPVSDPTGEPGGSCQSEVSIAANCSFLVAAWNDGEGCSICDPPTSSQGFAYSSDGGKTWTDGGSPPNTNIGIWASDPVVVVNPTTGAFYYAGLCDLPSGMNGIGVVKGTFNGSVFSWETPKLVRQVSTSSDVLDKEWLAVDPSSGTLFLSYTHFTASGDRIEFERSTDDNQTWTNLQTLSSSQESGFVQGSRPAVGPDGEVYVTWEAIGQGNRQSPTFNSLYGRDFMRIRKSTNGGLSFGPQLTADSLFSNFGSGAPGFNRATGVTFPGIAVDRSTGPHRGRVYLTWNESLDFYEDDLGLGTKQSEIEPDNTPAQATAFVLGQVLRGASAATSKTGVDLDYFSFLGTQGQTVVLWLDSLDVNLDAAFRLYCNDVHINDPDYPTRLSFSGTDGTPGLPAGSQGLLVYTLPADGTYYLRLASFHGATGGSYRVQTGLHDPRSAPMDDRARDHRDVFVKTSDNGITWNSTVRVNDDPGYFDDWLPEVAVSGDGRAHVAYYDWRDAVDDCGGSSNVYLSRSDDGGATWSPGAAISTVRSDWSIGSSNLIPNQGDYISIFGTDTTVVAAWGDFRRGDPDVFAYVPPTSLCCTSATVTVVDVAVAATLDTVTVTWDIANGADSTVTIWRLEGGGASYESLGTVTADGSGKVRFVDPTVTAGNVYVYRLGLHGFCQSFAGQVQVGVRLQLALEVHPNPTSKGVQVRFSLESDAPATLELLDITGRRIHSREVGGFGSGGPVDVDLTQGLETRAGLYFVRLSQGGRTITARVAVVP